MVVFPLCGFQSAMSFKGCMGKSIIFYSLSSIFYDLFLRLIYAIGMFKTAIGTFKAVVLKLGGGGQWKL